MQNNSASSTIKAAKSSQFFKNTRVESCSHIVVRNGVAEAVPYKASPKKEEASKQACSTSLTQ